MSCSTVAAYIYDANGHGRWCIDCNEPLGEVPARESHPFAWLAIAVLALALLGLFAALIMRLEPPGNPVPFHTPTTHGAPAATQ